MDYKTLHILSNHSMLIMGVLITSFFSASGMHGFYYEDTQQDYSSPFCAQSTQDHTLQEIPHSPQFPAELAHQMTLLLSPRNVDQDQNLFAEDIPQPKTSLASAVEEAQLSIFFATQSSSQAVSYAPPIQTESECGISSGMIFLFAAHAMGSYTPLPYDAPTPSPFVQESRYYEHAGTENISANAFNRKKTDDTTPTILFCTHPGCMHPPFMTAYGLYNHIQGTHQGGFICDYPECTHPPLTSKGALLFHKQIAHLKQFVCTHADCRKVLRSAYDLKMHMQGVHEKSFACTHEGCTHKPFALQKTLEEHLIGFHGPGFPCTEEGCTHAPFASKTMLYEHIQTAHKKELFCTHEGCTRTAPFKKLSELNEHIEGVHSLGFSCTIPGCTVGSFKTKNGLIKHTKGHHGGGYLCKIPGCAHRPFKSKTGRDNHRKTHK